MGGKINSSKTAENREKQKRLASRPNRGIVGRAAG